MYQNYLVQKLTSIIFLTFFVSCLRFIRAEIFFSVFAMQWSQNNDEVLTLHCKKQRTSEEAGSSNQDSTLHLETWFSPMKKRQ